MGSFIIWDLGKPFRFGFVTGTYHAWHFLSASAHGTVWVFCKLLTQQIFGSSLPRGFLQCFSILSWSFLQCCTFSFLRVFLFGFSWNPTLPGSCGMFHAVALCFTPPPSALLHLAATEEQVLHGRSLGSASPCSPCRVPHPAATELCFSSTTCSSASLHGPEERSSSHHGGFCSSSCGSILEAFTLEAFMELSTLGILGALQHL